MGKFGVVVGGRFCKGGAVIEVTGEKEVGHWRVDPQHWGDRVGVWSRGVEEGFYFV